MANNGGTRRGAADRGSAAAAAPAKGATAGGSLDGHSVDVSAIALKDGLQPGGGGGAKGGLRSPIAAQAQAEEEARRTGETGRNAVSQQPSPLGREANKAGEKGAFQRRELSAIHGLDGSPIPTNGTQPLSHVMFDKSRRRAARLGRLAFFGIALAVVAGLYQYPNVRIAIVDRTLQLKNDVMSAVRPPRSKLQKMQPKGYYMGSVRKLPREQENADAVTILPRGDCHKTIRAAAGAAKLAVSDRVALADCYLQLDSPADAEQVLEPLKDKFLRTPDATLNMMSTKESLADGLQLYVQAMLKQGKPRDADALMRAHCLEWMQTNACVAKLMVYAERRLPMTQGMWRLFDKQTRLDGRAQARLWLAGAKLASLEGKYQTVDQRYTQAASAAPKGDLGLLKQIYETQAIDLWRRGDMGQLRRVLGRASAALRLLDKPAKMKLALLGDLVNPATRMRNIKTMVSREEVTYKAKGDIDFIEILAPECLRYGYSIEFSRLLQRTREHYVTKYRSSSAILRQIAAWEVRTALSLSQYDQALTMLAAYERDHGRDMLSRHLRGVVYLESSTNPKYQLLAAQEFQAALRTKINWEPLYALGVAWIRGGKVEPVAPVIKDLERAIATPGQRYWLDMLKAEWYTAKGMTPNAHKLLTEWTRKDGKLVTPHRILLQLSMKNGKRTEAEAEGDILRQMASRQRYATSREGFASPIGFMALGQRPLE